MNAVKRTLEGTVPVLLAMCLLAVQKPVAFAQGDPHVGSWELNLSKSTFNPGPPPKRQTLYYKENGKELMALFQGVDGAGLPINPDASNLTIYFDGKDHPTPRAGYDASAWTRISPNKYVVNRKKAGKVVLTSSNEVSNDGRTLTITTTGVDENGRSITNVSVYDKQ